jgi:hypothetical protein
MYIEDLINSLDCLFLIFIAFILSICLTYDLLIYFAFYYIRMLTALTFFYSYPYIKSSSESEYSLSVWSIMSSAIILERLLFIYLSDFRELIFFIFIQYIKCLKIKIVIVIVNLTTLII